MNANIEIKVPVLRSLSFAFSTPTTFGAGAVLPSTTRPINFFMSSDDCSSFARNCSLTRISTKPMSAERLMSLQPPEGVHEVKDSAERSKRIGEQKWSAFKKVPVEEVAKNKNKGTHIGSERLSRLSTGKSRDYVQS